MLAAKEISTICKFDPGIREHVATELASSLPVPVRQGRELIALAFYYARDSQPPGETFTLYPPGWLAEVDWSNGALRSVREQPPAFFGLGGDRFTPFASVSYVAMNEGAARAGLADVTQRVDEFLSIYDRVLPAWATQAAPPQPETGRFRLLLSSIVEAALLPVYRRLAPDFFAWLDRA